MVDLQGNGQDDFIFANTAANRVFIQFPGGAEDPLLTPAGGALAPSAALAAHLGPGATPDIIIINSGRNEVLIYSPTGQVVNGLPQFAAPLRYAVGDNPVSVTVADLNGDGVPDLLVTNEGSNDISVLLGGETADGQWFATPGPRLHAGGVGPVSTVLADVTGDGRLDLVVTDSRASTAATPALAADGVIAVLPGLGKGFFADSDPRTFLTGVARTQSFLDAFSGDGRLDLVTINHGDGPIPAASRSTRTFRRCIARPAPGEPPPASGGDQLRGGFTPRPDSKTRSSARGMRRSRHRQ